MIDVRTYKEVFRLDDDAYVNGYSSNKLGVSPSGQYVMVGGKKGRIFIFDLVKQELEEVLDKEHTATINSCDWQKKGNKAASIDVLGSLYIWS